MREDRDDERKIMSPVQRYFKKWGTTKRCTLQVPGPVSLVWSFIGAFIGVLLVSYIGMKTDFFPLFAPFGASAVLLYGPATAPFSQPRSLIGGHVLSALVGVIVYTLFGASFVSVALAVALAVIVMKVTKTVHPPAGATALLGVTASGGSFMWVIGPVLIGAVILLFVALIINNLDRNLRYPDYWW
ncbi:MAG: HPP family protein [Sphaerochaeta sp.]|nr:HPP family protein [Sphaerochaeta sp.]